MWSDARHLSINQVLQEPVRLQWLWHVTHLVFDLTVYRPPSGLNARFTTQAARPLIRSTRDVFGVQKSGFAIK